MAKALTDAPRGSGSGDPRDGIRRRLVTLARAYRSRWTLLSLATFLYWVATQALRPYVPLFLADLQASETTVGLAVAAHPLLSLFLAIPAGRLMDVRGLRRVMVASLAAMIAAGAAYAVVTAIPAMFALQAFAGLTELGSWVGMQALVTQIGDQALRRHHLALFSVLWALGVAVGPTIGALIFDRAGFTGVGILYGICAAGALVAVVGIPFRDRPGERGRDRNPDREASTLGTGIRRAVGVARRPAVAATLLASFVMLWANSLRTSFYPLFLERQGVPIPTIGLLVSLSGITLLLSRFPLPILVSRFRSMWILLCGTTAAVLAVTTTPLIVASTVALWLAAAIFGIGFGLNSPVSIDIIADETASEDRGLAMGMRIAANRLAQVSQPITFGAAASFWGLGAGFGVGGLVMGVGLAYAWRTAWRVVRR